jgi:hypothetical protein
MGKRVYQESMVDTPHYQPLLKHSEWHMCTSWHNFEVFLCFDDKASACKRWVQFTYQLNNSIQVAIARNQSNEKKKKLVSIFDSLHYQPHLKTQVKHVHVTTEYCNFSRLVMARDEYNVFMNLTMLIKDDTGCNRNASLNSH